MLAQKRRRSRGCDQCRGRRCDETPGFCRQCLRFGLDCSGPLQGVTIINMTKQASLSLEKNKASRSIGAKKIKVGTTTTEDTEEVSRSRVNRCQVFHLSTVVESETLGTPAAKEETGLSLREPPGASMQFLYQPSYAEMTEDFLVTQFLALALPHPPPPGVPPGWITWLPSFVSSTRNSSLRCSIRATVTAFHGFLHQDTSAKLESRQWYIAGLTRYRRLLSDSPQMTIVSDNDIPGFEEILIPLMLCLFEVFSGTTAIGCFHHLSASCLILSMRGPENCKVGLIHHMFRSLRVSESCVSILTGNPSRFASLEWRTIPFLELSKPPLHHLVDIMMLIPQALKCCDQGTPFTETLQYLSCGPPNGPEIEQRCLQLLKRLDDWWIKFGGITRVGQSLPEYSSVAEAPMDCISFPNTFTAFTYSVFNATVIVLRTALIALSSCHSASDALRIRESQIQLILSHCEYILEIATFHGEKCPMGFDFMRSTFPVKIVEMLSPSKEQRMQAKEVTEKWGVFRGLGGILEAEILADHVLQLEREGNR